MSDPVDKIIFCMRRLPHLARSEFQTYWREIHAPLVLERAPILSIDRYVQCHIDHDDWAKPLAAARGTMPGFDGVAEIWLRPSVHRGRYSAEEIQHANAELLEDERKFIDLAASAIFYTVDREIIRDSQPWPTLVGDRQQLGR